MSTSADSFHSHSEGHPPSSDALDSLDAVEHSSSMAARENRHEPELDQTQVTSREGLALSSIDQIWNSSPRNTARITFDEYLSLSEITFEWGDSYDDKDWSRLRAILAPTLMIDYSEVNGHKWEHMPANDFVDIMSHIGFIGDPLVHTQHHIGASKWHKLSEESIIGHHQLRAAHQRYTTSDMTVVENKGHGHAMIRHYYKKLDGEWKLAGLRPTVRWNEFEFDQIFRGF